jgi:hypothetical protein
MTKMNNATSCLLGILFTFICSTIPFIISSRQLSKEAKRLVTLSNLIIRGIEESGLAKFSRNAEGEPVGLRFNITVSDSINLSSSISSDENTETKSNT